MKAFITTVFLICAAMLLVSPQAGLAYQTLEGGCLSCHSSSQLHPIHSAQTCTVCHPGAAGAKPILSSTCAVCHPRTGDKGLCPIINVAAHAGNKQTCLACHTSCAPANTTTVPANTTTTVPANTTTTVPANTTTTVTPTTTTTSPAGPCPAEAVLGEGDPRLDTLRAFRDQVLAKNPNGQKLIKQYYGSSSAVVKMLESNPGLKDSAREYLEAILPAIEKITKEKAGKK